MEDAKAIIELVGDAIDNAMDANDWVALERMTDMMEELSTAMCRARMAQRQTESNPWGYRSNIDALRGALQRAEDALTQLDEMARERDEARAQGEQE